jgi:hypothetical protein
MGRVECLVGFAMTAVVAGCGDSNDGTIELRPAGDDTVTRSEFHCTGTWPAGLSPCEVVYGYDPVAMVHASAGSPVEIGLSSAVVDLAGDNVSVEIRLTTEPGAPTKAVAHAIIVSRSETREVPALSGWIEPIVTGTFGGRTAGRFSIDFEWGSISGDYDSCHPPADPDRGC